MCVSRVRLRAEITRSGRHLLPAARADYREDESANYLDFGFYAIAKAETVKRRGKGNESVEGCARSIAGEFARDLKILGAFDMITGDKLGSRKVGSYGIILRPWVKRELFVITRGRINSNFADIFYSPHAWRVKLISFAGSFSTSIRRFSTRSS